MIYIYSNLYLGMYPTIHYILYISCELKSLTTINCTFMIHECYIHDWQVMIGCDLHASRHVALLQYQVYFPIFTQIVSSYEWVSDLFLLTILLRVRLFLSFHLLLLWWLPRGLAQFLGLRSVWFFSYCGKTWLTIWNQTYGELLFIFLNNLCLK